jgi:hypothetical protein
VFDELAKWRHAETTFIFAVRTAPWRAAAADGDNHAAADRAGRRDVRLRPRRAVVGPLAGPPRRDGLGGDGADLRGAGRAPGEGSVEA